MMGETFRCDNCGKEWGPDDDRIPLETEDGTFCDETCLSEWEDRWTALDEEAA